MVHNPLFSVVLPTYGRGLHIKPTIESVLFQSLEDFELIIVGDGCTDETESVVHSFAQKRIRWLNLPQHTGSQSFPNNEGIWASRGQWIAYIGHDDIWAPNHLETMAEKITSSHETDFVVAGCVYHGPRGADTYWVTGLFETREAPLQHFFPPSSIAHRRDVPIRIGAWKEPRIIKPPVDAEFLLRAAKAGLLFASTGKITVHKFAAGHRYLSYLRASSEEQWEMLRALNEPAIDVDRLVGISRKTGQYMTMRYVDFSSYPTGYLFEQNRQNKGISRSALQPLRRRVLIEQTEESRALDWHELEMNGKPCRWSGPNPRPKILIPYTGQRASIVIEIVAKPPDSDLNEVTFFVEAQRTDYVIHAGDDRIFRLTANIPLKTCDYTVLTLDTPMFCPADMGSADTRKLGLMVADVLIEPI